METVVGREVGTRLLFGIMLSLEKDELKYKITILKWISSPVGGGRLSCAPSCMLIGLLEYCFSGLVRQVCWNWVEPGKIGHGIPVLDKTELAVSEDMNLGS